MNQLRALSQHLKEKHLEDANGNSILKRLGVWLENTFIPKEKLDKIAKLPSELVSPEEILATSRVKAMVLARDIS